MRAIELRAAHLSEFDFDNALWLIPEERMKMCPPHSVPLSKQIFAQAALMYRYGEEHQPLTEAQVLQLRRVEDKKDDLWTVYQRLQENLIKGGLSGRNAKGIRISSDPHDDKNTFTSIIYHQPRPNNGVVIGAKPSLP